MWVLVLSILPFGLPTQAQDHTRLARILDGRGDFRIRVQAALALGNRRDEWVLAPLHRALRDPSPAVRAAAASALGRIGSPRSLTALRRANRDRSAAVRMQVQRSIRTINSGPTPATASVSTGGGSLRSLLRPSVQVVPSEASVAWPRVRYVILLGTMRNRSGYAGDDMVHTLRAEVRQNLRLLRRVAILDASRQLEPQATREIQRRNIPKLRLEGNLNRVVRRRAGADLTVRCEVSVLVFDEQQRSMRGELRGTAMGSESRRRLGPAQVERLATRALAGAVRSALSNAPQALAQAARL